LTTSSPSLLRRIARGLLSVPVAIWLLFEDWVWNNLLALMAYLGKLPPIAWVERQIAKSPPYVALIAFLIPATVLLPFKLLALWLIAQGQAALGALVFIIAKIIGTAFIARIFSLTKPALLTISWFRRSYEWLVAWKERLYAYLRGLPAYRWIGQWLREMREELRVWWRRERS
jgi:hypothetical protein